jgi:hypothetical protein
MFVNTIIESYYEINQPNHTHLQRLQQRAWNWGSKCADHRYLERYTRKSQEQPGHPLQMLPEQFPLSSQSSSVLES